MGSGYAYRIKPSIEQRHLQLAAKAGISKSEWLSRRLFESVDLTAILAKQRPTTEARRQTTVSLTAEAHSRLLEIADILSTSPADVLEMLIVKELDVPSPGLRIMQATKERLILLGKQHGISSVSAMAAKLINDAKTVEPELDSPREQVGFSFSDETMKKLQRFVKESGRTRAGVLEYLVWKAPLKE